MSKFNEFELEQNLAALAERANPSVEFLDSFPLEILRAYQVPAAQIARIEKDRGPSMLARDLVIPKQMAYRPAQPGKAHEVVAQLKAQRKAGKVPGKTEPRFLVSTDGEAIAAIDLKLDADFKGELIADLPIEYDFFHPMFGVERYIAPTEQKVDVDAARVMRELHNAFTAYDPEWKTETKLEALNTFMVRLLFCLFADGSGVFDRAFKPGAEHDAPFKKAMNFHASSKDGSQTARAISQAFKILNLPESSAAREAFEPRYRKLPYANGRLFEQDFTIPTFNGRAQRAFRRALELVWGEINADIFGSMIQAIAQDEERSSFGMHYTSVPNIMKVLGPLFLDELKEQLAAAGNNAKRLQALIDRIADIHIFDPAAGSGNFLIIAYRELRAIETAALQLLHGGQMHLDIGSSVKLDHFHGIDPNDFACRTARLSLWISQIQADRRLADIGINPPAILPLHDAGDIRQGSALEIKWTDITPRDAEETYIVGNPPYIGSTYQSSEQKKSMDAIFKGKLRTWGNLDFVSAWFALATQHIKLTGSKAAMVTTNSLCQGESVPTLWPWIIKQDVEISFAYTSFKWTNSASKNAGVACAIIGLQRKGLKCNKTIHTTVNGSNDKHISVIDVSNINPYLASGPNIIVEKSAKPMNGLPDLTLGNLPRDGGHLLLSQKEYDDECCADPRIAQYLFPIVGSKELIHNIQRWCLWIPSDLPKDALDIPSIQSRIAGVVNFRNRSISPIIRGQVDIPHRFGQIQFESAQRLLVVPQVFSEKRDYIAADYFDGYITTQAYGIIDAPAWVLAILSSRLMHQWLHTIGGKLEDRTRFSNTLVYNTFPAPDLLSERKAVLNRLGLKLIAVRQPYIDDSKTMAWLYDPKTMPKELLAVHQEIDEELESMYIGRNFISDAERLGHLFKLYATRTKVQGNTK